MLESMERVERLRNQTTFEKPLARFAIFTQRNKQIWDMMEVIIKTQKIIIETQFEA